MNVSQHSNGTQPLSTEDAELRQEGIIIGTYLLKRPPNEFVIDRYVAGVNILFTQPLHTFDKKIQTFIQQHPNTLPYLDAASGVFNPKRLLRNKILLMVAILETIPDYCDEFFTASYSKSKFAFEIISIGFATAFQVGIGALLTMFIQMKR